MGEANMRDREGRSPRLEADVGRWATQVFYADGEKGSTGIVRAILGQLDVDVAVVPRLWPDGSTLYYCSADEDWSVITNWQAPIIPTVDFNGDEAVDLADLVMLIDNWGTDDSLYDIGPMPWGDGKVDIEDLKVFVAEWEKENPPAEP
jgi:hypothetical protein